MEKGYEKYTHHIRFKRIKNNCFVFSFVTV